MWTNGKVLKLIQDFHGCHCLWDVTSPDYKNRVKRKAAVEFLAAKHTVTVSEIEKKIHNLKTSFNRERRKVAPKNGTSPKKSTWFAYEYLQFLLPAKELRDSWSTVLDDTESGSNVDEDSLLDTGDNDEQGALNADEEREDPRKSFKTPRNPPKRVRKNEDYPAQQAVNCMKSHESEIGTTTIRDENSVFGEYVANKTRNCNRPRVEVSLAQRYINDILFRLDVGLLAAEIPSIQAPSTFVSSHSPSSCVSQDSYCSNPSTPTAGEGDVQLQQQSSESRDEIGNGIRIHFVQDYSDR